MVEQLGADTLVAPRRTATSSSPRAFPTASLPEVGSTLRSPPTAGASIFSTPRAAPGFAEMAAHFARDWPYPRLVAHRGAGKLAPENTLTAMRVGHAHGYRMVEFDVKLSARQRLVPAARRDARAHDERPRTRRRAALARAVAARRRRLALGQVRRRAAADARVDRALGARARRRLQHRDQADARAASARPAPPSRSTRRRCGATPRCRRCCRRSPRRRSRPRAMPSPALPRALLLESVPADWEDAPRAARMRRARRRPRGAHARRSSPTVARGAGIAVLCLHAQRADARSRELAGWGVDGIITDAVDQHPADSLPPRSRRCAERSRHSGSGRHARARPLDLALVDRQIDEARERLPSAIDRSTRRCRSCRSCRTGGRRATRRGSCRSGG